MDLELVNGRELDVTFAMVYVLMHKMDDEEMINAGELEDVSGLGIGERKRVRRDICYAR